MCRQFSEPVGSALGQKLTLSFSLSPWGAGPAGKGQYSCQAHSGSEVIGRTLTGLQIGHGLCTRRRSACVKNDFITSRHLRVIERFWKTPQVLPRYQESDAKPPAAHIPPSCQESQHFARSRKHGYRISECFAYLFLSIAQHQHLQLCVSLGLKNSATCMQGALLHLLHGWG